MRNIEIIKSNDLYNIYIDDNKLNVRWTQEIMDDLNLLHGINSKYQLMDIIIKEIDLILKNKLTVDEKVILVKEYEKLTTTYKIPDDLYCPFCNLCGFDAIGLKNHLLWRDCKPFNDVE